MKQKKGKEVEQLDLSTLPPWFGMNCIIKFDTKLSRAENILHQLNHNPKSFTKNINREDIINYAKEKGLYIDPNTLNEKQLKAQKGELPTELTPQIIVTSFQQFQYENEIQGRKDKQAIRDGVEIPPGEEKKVAKKDAKKDAKKAGKIEVEEEEGVKVVEKEFKKAIDMINFLHQFPLDETELLEISNQKEQIDLVLYISQKVPQIVVEEEHIDEANQEEYDEEPLAHSPEDNLAKKIQEQEALTLEDINFMKENRDFIKLLRGVRSRTDRNSSLRKTVIKEITYEVDPFNEQESLKTFMEFLTEEICAFSLDCVQFKEWLAEKKAVPLQKPNQKETEARAIAAKKLESELAAQQLQMEAEAKEKEKDKGKKKDTKKDTKKDDKHDKHEEVVEKVIQVEIQQVKKEEIKQAKNNSFFTYNKQLNPVKLEETGAGIMLEMLLDQIDSEKDPNPNHLDPKVEEENASVIDILTQLKWLTQSTKPDHVKSPTDNLMTIIEENDDIRRRGIESQFSNHEKLVYRERMLQQQMNFPGVDRWLMPDMATKSDQLRNAEKSQIYPFITSVQDFERNENVLRFENILKEQEPDIPWNLGDRVYVEKHNKNTLTQTLYKQLLFEQQIMAKYNERDDNLYLTLFYKNPQGRMMRQKWSADWKMLPNLENWIIFFKNNDNNLKNEVYYDFDYELIGNFYEYTKLLFPSDDSIIIGTKYLVGDKFNYRYKILKEGSVMGIKEEGDHAQFFAHFDNETRFLVSIDSQGEEEQEIKASITMTLVNGLVVKFLHNGDVFQQILRKEESQKIKNFEVKRIISGKGSVIRYFSDGSILIYYANGNTSQTHINNTWITTNNKGFRKLRKDGMESEYEPISCAKRTDPRQKSQIIIRSDQTLIIYYADGRVLAKFEDGTQILTTADNSQIIVEHADFTTIRVSFDGEEGEKILSFQDSHTGQDNLFERSYDGKIVETFLFDGSRVIGYTEVCRQDSSYKNNYVHLVYLEDGAVAKVTNEGDIVFISSVDRLEMKDGYWTQLFCSDDDRRGGTYTCSLQLGQLWTQDNDGNFFSIYSNGNIEYSIKEINAYNTTAEEKLVRPSTPVDLQDGDFIDDELKVLQKPTKFKQPRLFIINNDNNGQEFLNENQFKNYLNQRNNDPNTFIQIEKKQFPQGGSKYSTYSFITRFIPLKQRRITLINCEIPTDLDILTTIDKKQEIDQNQFFLYRNIFEYEKITPAIRQKHLKELETFQNWRKDQFRSALEYGVGRKQKSEKLKQCEIQLRILENRRSQYSESKPDEDLHYQVNLFKQNYHIVDEYQNQQITCHYADQAKIPGTFNVAPSSGVCLTYQIDQIENVIQKLEERKIKAVVKEVQVQQKLKKKLNKKESVEEKWDESSKQLYRKDHFVSQYFDTLEGFDAFKEMLSKKLVDLNPPNKERFKNLKEEEVTGKPRTRLPSQEMQQNRSQSQHQPASDSQFYQQSPKQKTIQLKPSVFFKRDQDEFKRQQKEFTEAILLRKMKLQSVNVYGKERKESQKKSVPCLLKTNPKSELNAKYILAETQTDNRMKISSMHSRMYLKAPGINEIRKTGSHTSLAAITDKKYNLDNLESQKNLMITSDLNDKLRKDLLIHPVSIRFGMLRAGGFYEAIVKVKNEDILAQRIKIQQTQSKHVRVFMLIHGPINLGLIREVTVRIEASNEIFGRFTDEFQIISKHEIYKIPVTGNIMDGQDFDKMDQESRQVNKKSILRANIREVKYGYEQGIQQTNRPDLNDSQNSDLLPKLTNYNKEYKLDPYQLPKKKKNEEDDSLAEFSNQN